MALFRLFFKIGTIFLVQLFCFESKVLALETRGPSSVESCLAFYKFGFDFVVEKTAADGKNQYVTVAYLPRSVTDDSNSKYFGRTYDEVGIVTFFHASGTSNIKINRIDVMDECKNTRISARLLTQIINDMPWIKSIETDLTEDNEMAFHKAISDGLSPLDAIKETPAYKIRKRIGFSKIDKFDPAKPFKLVVVRDSEK